MKWHSVTRALGIVLLSLAGGCSEDRTEQRPPGVVLSVGGDPPEVHVTYFVVRPDGSMSKRYEVVGISNTVDALDSIGVRRTTPLTVGWKTGENAAYIAIVSNKLASAGFSRFTVEPYRGK
jgi:hypothetical protein